MQAATKPHEIAARLESRTSACVRRWNAQCFYAATRRVSVQHNVAWLAQVWLVAAADAHQRETRVGERVTSFVGEKSLWVCVPITCVSLITFFSGACAGTVR
jgi:TorA maturation chaperone TorD